MGLQGSWKPCQNLFISTTQFVLCQKRKTNFGNIIMTVKLVISCEALTLYTPFDGACFERAMNKTMNS
jgi:hypothetical protein